MNRKFPLQQLQDLSGMRLDEAARTLGKLIAGEQEADQRLATLVQYREEYRQRLHEAANNGVNPRIWRNYQNFLARLDEAVDQAHAMLDDSRRQTALGQKNWLEQRGKAKAFDALAQRHRSRVQRADVLSEQKESDEHGARSHCVGDEGDT